MARVYPKITKLPSPPYAPKAYEVQFLKDLPVAGDAGRAVRVIELGSNAFILEENRREFWIVDTGVGWSLVEWKPEQITIEKVEQ